MAIDDRIAPSKVPPAPIPLQGPLIFDTHAAWSETSYLTSPSLPEFPQDILLVEHLCATFPGRRRCIVAVAQLEGMATRYLINLPFCFLSVAQRCDDPNVLKRVGDCAEDFSD
jgi:hypothetical protein